MKPSLPNQTPTTPTPTPTTRVGPATITAARRGLMGVLAAGCATGLAAAGSAVLRPADTAAGPAVPEAGTDPALAEMLRQRERRTPDVMLLDHRGRPQRFYSDVMQGRRVIMNVMYTVCSNICAPTTRNLLEARQLLGSEGARLRFVSLTLTPLTDNPEALSAFRERHGIDGDWMFLTGTPQNVERVQRALGFIGDEEGDDLLSHSAMARYCDERYQRWTHINTLAPPRSIARSIRFEMA